MATELENHLETVPNAVIHLPKMDLIFIDGGKSYDVAWSDWVGSCKLMNSDTIVFVHNADFSGVNRMLHNVPGDRYSIELFNAPYEGKVAKILKK